MVMNDPQLDPTGALILELRSDGDLAALVGNRVRGYEPMGDVYADGTLVSRGDARGAGEYTAFVVISGLSDQLHPRAPVAFGEWGVVAYGTTPQNARAVWGAVVKALHAIGPRIKANGLGIYKTLVVSGGEQDKDPDTGQPAVRGTVRVVATTQVVT